MPNNIAVAITADVSKFSSQLAVAKVNLADFAKAQRDAARAVAAGDESVFARTQLLKAGEAYTKAAATVSLYQRELKKLEPAAEGAVHGIGGIVREFAVLGREGVNGNFTRMAGSATILTQRLASLGTATLATYAGAAALGVGFLALAGTLTYVGYESYKTEKAVESVAEAFALTGRSSGNSVDAVRANVAALGDMADVSEKVAQALIEFDATHAQVNSRISTAANQLIPQFTKAFGEKGVDELNKFKTELSEVGAGTTEQAIKKFNELNNAMLGFKPAQVQMIEAMIESGDRIGATTEILAQFAAQGGANIVSVKDQIVKAQAELTRAQEDAAALKSEVSATFDAQSLTIIQHEAMVADDKVRQLTARVQNLKAIDAVPARGETMESAFANSHATLLSLKDSASRAREAIATLHREMEQRRAANPADKEVVDYYANQAKVDHDLAKREDPGEFKKPKTPKKIAGESELTKYENQLRETETRIRESTGNWSRSMVAEEEKFWRDKLAAATKGTKLYGSLQTKFDEAKANAERQKAEDARAITESDASTKLSVQKADITTRRDQTGNSFSESVDNMTAKTAIGAAEAKRDALKALANEEAADEVAAIQIKAAAYTGDVVRQREAANQIQVVQAQHFAQEAAIDRQYTSDHQREVEKRKELDKKAAADQARAWKEANAEILSAESKLVSDIFGGRKSLGQMLIQVASSTAQKEITADLEYLTEKRLLNIEAVASDQATAKAGLLVHLLSNQQKTASTIASTTAQSAASRAQLAAQQSAQIAASTASAASIMATSKAQVVMLAGLAGAGGVASMAAAPFPLDTTAPAFGAQMASAAMSMGSFAQGANILPNDMIAQVHAGERIIPKADNEKLIAMTERGAGVARGQGTKAGDTHIHYAPTVNGQMPFGDQLAAHEDNIIAMLSRAVRRGVRFT